MHSVESQNETAEPEIFGRNVRSYRKGLGWTIEECAEKCGIGRATLKRIEGGTRCYRATQDKISRTFNIKRDALCEPELLLTRSWFHFPAEEARWSFSDPLEAARWALNEDPRRTDPDSIQNPGERQRLGRNGFATSFHQLHRCHLPDGFHSHMMLEVYGQPTFHTPAQVTSFCIYCIRGSLELYIGEEMLPLQTGDIFTFDTSLTVRLNNKQPLDTGELPPMVFATVLQKDVRRRSRPLSQE